jgi:alkanesulfonate monooxygenase SsuD/methylene tetrahydromethanopterin reductase-like flavin-dependent oxidoreductase (luciferase family)
MLFGLNVSTSARPGSDPVADARRAEELGFDFVSANDHLHGTQPTFEPWTMLTWIASATTRIGVATRVLGVPYRNPAVLAKMAESLQRLSGGRLILGMGGGASPEEFRAFGLGEWPPRARVDGMQDAIRIAKGLWSEPGFSYQGRQYRTESAEIEPKPDRAIPIWLGTYGERALGVTGRLADGWIPSLDDAPPEQVPALRSRVLAAAEEAGRSPEAITCVYNLGIRLAGEPDEGQQIVAGPPEAVVDRLLGFVSLGFAGFNFIPLGPGSDEQAERLAREVMPALRAAA